MRVGLIGVGRIGAAHAEVLHSHPEVDRLLLADADAPRARAVADRLGATAAPTVDDLFAGVDALVVATPTGSHAELILRGVDAGLPVFCEKPVAVDVKQTIEVVTRVAQAGAAVQIGFQRRFDEGYRAARDAVRRGDVGTVHRLHLVTADPAPPSPEYVLTSGGIFRDCHIHDFDIALWLLGQPATEVYATGTDHGAGAFAEASDVDTSAALIRFAGGTLATVQGSRYNGGGYDVRAEVAGTRGTYVVGLDDRVPLRSVEPGVEWPAGPPWPDFWQRFRPAYVAEIDAFLTLAAGRGPNRCPPADALAALYVAEAAELSRREHRPVRLDELT